MSIQLYNPFANLYFNNTTCFLTGDNVELNQRISVFPEWMMERYEWKGKRFTMMDKINSLPYEDLVLPASLTVQEKFNALDEEVRIAFEGGYETMKALDSYKLYIWMSRIVYGLLYHDLVIEKKLKERQSSEFQLADELQERYAIFHLMLQSFVAPIKFIGEIKPWNITIVKLNYSMDICNYRDDAVNMMFTMGTQEFGIIGCLLDNQTIIKEHDYLVQQIGDTALHAIQFEELCAHFQYSSYLLDYKPKFKIKDAGDHFEIEPLPITQDADYPIFDIWDDDTFATVLEGYFKPWGIEKSKIHTPPNSPLSFLVNEATHQFISPETITLQG